MIYLGRKDDQVKLLGHRIELDEIDSFLKQYQEITNAVTCFKTSDGTEKLLLYYQSKTDLNASDIVQFLKGKMPDYMVPRKYSRVEKFEYITSGKINRAKMIQNNSCIYELGLQGIFLLRIITTVTRKE